MAEDDFEVHPSGTYTMIGEDSLKLLTAAALLEKARCPSGMLQDHADCEWCEQRRELLREIENDD